MARHAYTSRSNDALLAAGTPVQVRTRFDGGWATGFAVADVVHDGPGGASYRLRRAVDGCVLPALFTADDVIPVSPTYANSGGARR